MSFIEMYGIAFLVILGLMAILWLVSLFLKNSSIVDIFWGMGFVISNWVYFLLTPDGFPLRRWLIGILVAIWGLRLSGYLLWRNRGKLEDFRYQKWRKEAGGAWWWTVFSPILMTLLLLRVSGVALLEKTPSPARLQRVHCENQCIHPLVPTEKVGPVIERTLP